MYPESFEYKVTSDKKKTIQHYEEINERWVGRNEPFLYSLIELSNLSIMN